MRYFRLLDDLNRPKDRWFLQNLNVVSEKRISVWEFLSPSRVIFPNSQKLSISIRQEGLPLDFTFADFELLIVNERVADLLSEEDCQLIPVEVANLKSGHSYYVVVILNYCDCLDETKSVFEKWQLDDPIRPDLAGDYKSISTLYIDPQLVQAGKSIFRLRKSENIIIVSDKLKSEFERIGITGIVFKELT